MVLRLYQPCHISHGAYWRNSQGVHPEPFTTEIRLQDMRENLWTPVDPANKVCEYFDYQHTIFLTICQTHVLIQLVCLSCPCTGW